MTFFPNPLVGSSTESRTWNQLQRQPGNSISIGATSGRTSESGMQPITNWSRQLAAGDRVDLDQEYQISGAAAAAHHEMIELQSNVARKELDRYLQQEAACDITAAGDVLLYNYHDDPFALAMSTLARKYNYARSTAAAAAAGSLVQTTSTGASVLPGQCDVDQLPSSEFHDQLEDGEDFMMTLNPVDLLLGILTPPRTLDHTKSFESFTAANLHEESTRMSEESGLRSTVIAGDHTTSASLYSTAGHEGSGTAKGFHLSSMEIDCSYSSADDGDDDDERPIAIVQQDPAETRSPHGILPAAHDAVKKRSTGSLQQAKFKPMTVLAKRLKLSLEDKLEDTLLEKIKDAAAKASVAGYNRKSAAAGRHGNLEQQQQQQQQQESSGCMSHGELQQPGSTADDLIGSVLDSTHDQGLHEERYDGPTTAGQGSGIISEAHEVAEDARDARQSRSRLHQNLITLKQSSDLQSLHSTSKSPFRVLKIAFPEIVAMGPPPSQALPRPRVGGARAAASSKRAHHQSKAAPEQSPAAAPQLQSPHLQHATSFLDAQSPSASHQFPQAAAAAFVGSRSTVSSCKPLDVEAAQAEKNEARTRSEAIRSYLEINQLKTQQQLMNMTEPRQLIKPRSEQQAAAAAAVSLVKPIKASPRRPPLHMTEDALLAAVSKSAVAAKRSNTDEYPWSKKQRAAVLTTEPARDHQQHVKLLPECHSNLPPAARV
ncbi:unnamed protein product [Sphagnum jensenii]|uniref:Uncharacterized protein n=1 Tax=Sphagnum jensenii TaxID=128206 RepID=A0ABP1A701_9BRYO